MKKLIFAFALLLGMGLISCGRSSEISTTDCDSICDTIVVDTIVADTVAIEDSVL